MFGFDLKFELLEQNTQPATPSESKPRVEQVDICVHLGEYSRALDLLPG
jgi:hypothetical protein